MWPLRKQPSNLWMLLVHYFAKKTWESFIFKKHCDWIVFFQVPRFKSLHCKHFQFLFLNLGSLTTPILTHSLLEILPKKVCFEASQAAFWSLLSSIKSENLPQSHLQVIHFVVFWSRCQKLACEVSACAESFHLLSSFFFLLLGI